MRAYVGQRLLSALVVLWGVASLVFVLMRALPGSPAAVLAAQSGGSAADVARLGAAWGLDRPLWQQYIAFMLGLIRGELGRSLLTRQAVAQILAQQAAATAALAGAAMGVAVSVGLSVGMLGAWYRSGWPDRGLTWLSVVGISLPVSIWGLLLIGVAGKVCPWLPSAGQGTMGHLILPALTLGLISAAAIARTLRTQLDEVLDREYIMAARARGLSERHVLMRHAWRNAMIPTLNIIGLQLGQMLSGAVITESLFARAGLGRTLAEAILYHDYPVVQGVVLLGAVVWIGVHLLTDLAGGYLDPRLYHE